MRTIGLMSGTSLDGVDAAWIDTDGHTVTGFGPALTLPYEPELRRELRRLIDRAPALDPADPAPAALAARLTAHHVAAVQALGVDADLLGFHGQTILHRPAEGRTWQIGDAALLARETRIPVAWDFRTADVAAGGQGAPLAPVYHAALARPLVQALAAPVAVLNIGGVANLSWLGPEGTLLALDTGPGNALLDDWAMARTGMPLDRDGVLAAAGRPVRTLVAELMAHPYFARPAPKSLDRQDFAAALDLLAGLSAADGAATLAAFTAAAVAAAPLPAPPRLWLVTGGGRHNPALMAALATALGAERWRGMPAVPPDALLAAATTAEVLLAPVEAVGWDGDALEAQCFGLLAARVAAGLPLSFPATTGVDRPCAGGRIARP